MWGRWMLLHSTFHWPPYVGKQAISKNRESEGEEVTPFEVLVLLLCFLGLVALFWLAYLMIYFLVSSQQFRKAMKEIEKIDKEKP